MKTVDTRVGSRTAERMPWPQLKALREATGRGIASAWRRSTSQGWIAEFVGLTLALFLVGAAAFYGLAMSSAWTATPRSPFAAQTMPISHEPGACAVEPGLCEEGIR